MLAYGAKNNQYIVVAQPREQDHTITGNDDLCRATRPEIGDV
jgi:hypothetical protein